MPLGFAALPLGPAELRALADGSYTIVDQAMRTPGLLIIQSPDQATGDGRQATEEAAQAPPEDSAEDPTPVA